MGERTRDLRSELLEAFLLDWKEEQEAVEQAAAWA